MFTLSTLEAFLSIVVLHPVNLNLDLTITLQPGEYNFERPAYDIDIHIEELHLNIDPKQFSDLLDFIKFQNYSILYGNQSERLGDDILIVFAFEDRCREYRTLQMQFISNNIDLTPEQYERIHVKIISLLHLLSFSLLKYLESKLDVFNLAYIRHSVEMEIPSSSVSNSIRTTSTSASNSHHHKWYHSFLKNKTHSKGNERRKSSTASSITNHGDFFSEDVNIFFLIVFEICNLFFSLQILIFKFK